MILKQYKLLFTIVQRLIIHGMTNGYHDKGEIEIIKISRRKPLLLLIESLNKFFQFILYLSHSFCEKNKLFH